MQGTTIPEVIFETRVRDNSIGGDNPYKWEKKSTSDFFGEGRNVLFSLPGAFTPTCSAYQLPGFDRLADEFFNLGVKNIYCISVNDSFVMNAWKKQQEIKNVKVIPDGNGEFTRYMGMLINKEHLGFGQRSWRYAAIVSNMQVDGWFEEPGINNSGLDSDPYGETTPEKLLEWIKKGKD